LENFLWCRATPVTVFPCKTRHITDDDLEASARGL
jgi:hypothetical protein